MRKGIKVLIVGSGGREHALAWKIRQSPLVKEVFCAPGNAGTALIAKNVALKEDDINGLLLFADIERIDLTIPGPELSLVLGIVNKFRAEGLIGFGPSQRAAILESSKIFMKEFCARHNIPTAPYRVFSDPEKAIAYIQSRPFPFVVKADGLAGGKGVTVCHDLRQALAALRKCFGGEFGDAGKNVIIEDCLFGEEVSFIVMVDGNGNILPLESSQDHKARDDNDEGPNTGGMGAYSPAPIVTAELKNHILEAVIYPTVEGMEKEDRSFCGFLYAGLMIDEHNKPHVLEFNVRLGDPEAQPLLMRMKSDIIPPILAAIDGDLDLAKIYWDDRPALCIAMASKGYPNAYEVGHEIAGIEKAEETGAKVFHAGTKINGADKLVNIGGRVLGVTALGKTFKEAQDNAYKAVDLIECDNLFYRRDIGHRAVEREKEEILVYNTPLR